MKSVYFSNMGYFIFRMTGGASEAPYRLLFGEEVDIHALVEPELKIRRGNGNNTEIIFLTF